MGEYGRIRGTGERVKLGTCEDLYYLRWDQRDRVTASDTPLHDPEVLEVVRFRFPFPDEDDVQPGAFDPFDRGLTLWGFRQPEGVEHGSTQFVSSYPGGGYVVSLPCPEDPIHGDSPEYVIHRNGYRGPAAIVQQGWRGGRLVTIARCNGCGARYRLEDGHELEAYGSIFAQAEREYRTAEQNDTPGNADIGARLLEIGRRMLEGYGLEPEGHELDALVNHDVRNGAR